MSRYDDIINLPHHVSKVHKPMSMESRASQFAPFAALSGYGDAVKETARLTDNEIKLDDGIKEIINDKLQCLLCKIKSNPYATFTYFIKDESKSGGKYRTVSNKIKKIDLYNQYVILIDSTKIPINDITDISSELFNDENFI